MKKDPLRLKWLFLGSLIINTGISFIWPLTTIYMHEYLHEPLTTAGLVLLFNSLLTIVGNYFGGWLFDHWHAYQTILVGIIIATTSTAALIFWNGWPAYPLLLLALGFGNGIVATSVNSTATLIRSRQPSYVFNVLYFTNNLGLVFGSLIVGYILPLGISVIFTIAFFLFLIYLIVIVLTYRGINTARAKTAAAKPGVEDTGRTRQIGTIFILLLVLFMSWIAYEQWQSNISAYMLQLHMSVKAYSHMWTLNALLIVIFQPILTHFDDFLSKHLRGRLYAGFLLFASAFLFLTHATSYWNFAASMAVLTLGEVLAFPAVPTFVNERVSLREKGKYQGLVMAAASAGRAVGPIIGAFIIESASYQILFYFCVIIIVTSTGIFAFTHGRHFDHKENEA